MLASGGTQTGRCVVEDARETKFIQPDYQSVCDSSGGFFDPPGSDARNQLLETAGT